jgi:oligopeptide/dipeptide ABC transporter ATP-binding protein
MARLLAVKELWVDVLVNAQRLEILSGVSFEVHEGESVALVGESGAGKSMTARAIMRSLPRSARCTGSITFAGRSVLEMGHSELRKFRASEIAMIFQDPRAHINPVLTVGNFLTESLQATRGLAPDTARALAIESLDQVRISNARARLRQFPHELSGGMLQRVMIAAALLVEPRLLLADEPTTALDVTTQADIMAILEEQRRERGLALVFVSHDLELAAATCDRTIVMYAGRVAEEQPSASLHDRAYHPYAIALAETRPSLTDTVGRIPTIAGRPVAAYEATTACRYAPRCPHAAELCSSEVPPLRRFERGHVACHFAESLWSSTQAGCAGS